MIDYTDYIARKLSTVPSTGIAGDVALPASMFPHQRILTAWAIKRGRAAIFADTGLGKSRMQLAWADAVQRHTRKPVLILAPLALAQHGAYMLMLLEFYATERPLPTGRRLRLVRGMRTWVCGGCA